MEVPALHGDDLELFNRLRDKYKGVGADSMPKDPNAPGAEMWQPTPVPAGADAGELTISSKGANVEVKMCPNCQGAGTYTEVYEHRRMEKHCTTCSGRGVRVYKDGVEVIEGEGTETHQHQQDGGNDDSVDKPQHPIMQQDKEMSDDDAEHLRDEYKALGDKEKNYAQELSWMQSQLESCTVAEEKKLREDVIAQLNTQLKRVRTLKARKEAQLRLAGRW